MSTRQSPPKPPPPPTVVRWEIQNQSGKISGPFSTAEVLKQISEGLLMGGEKIMRYPDGSWVVISKQPQFYDHLLNALNEVADYKKPENKSRVSKVTVSKIEPEKKPEIELSKPVFSSSVVQQQPQTIDLSDFNQMKSQQKIRQSFLPLALVFLAVIFGAVSYFWPAKVVSTDKPHLILPSLKAEITLRPEQLKPLMLHALTAFTSDSFEGYWDSQNNLVTMLEGSSQNIEARGLLCLAYKELWPFVRQDSKDIEAVQILSKTTKSIDPIGINGVYCEVSQLMIAGKYQEARGALDHALNQPLMSASPVLLQMKAEILASEKDYKSAILYLERAQQLWPEWAKSDYLLGNYYSAVNQPAKASEFYEKTLQRNSKHRNSQVEYAGVLLVKFKQLDSANNYLSAALNSNQKITRSTEAKMYFFAAILQQTNKNFPKALEYARKSFALNPADAKTKDLLTQLGGAPDLGIRSGQMNELVFLGDQYARAGDCLSAQAEYKAAYEIDPKNALAATKAAKCLWQLSQSQEAISWLGKAIFADKKMGLAYYMLADYQSQRFNYVAAAQALNQGSAILGNNFEILRGYGLVEFRRNNFKDAVGYLVRASKVFENDLDTTILLAKSYSALGEFQKAQTYSVRAIEIDSTNPDAQITYAKTLVQFKGIDSGVFYLKDLIGRYSYTIDYRIALAEMLKNAERFKQSEDIYRQIIEVDPKNKKAVMGLAESFHGQGLFDKAVKLYLDAAVLDPFDAEPLIKVGSVYLESNKPKDAIVHFKRALKVNPMYPRGYYFVGKAAQMAGDTQLALQSAAEEKKNNPSLADPYILAAEVYASVRDYQKCASEYQQALKLRSQGAEIYVQIAKCYRLSGNIDVAENMLNIAASQESGFAEIYKEQGAIYEQKGDRRAAIQAYTKYLDLSPNAPDRSVVESRISILASGR